MLGIPGRVATAAKQLAVPVEHSRARAAQAQIDAEHNAHFHADLNNVVRNR
jgi:hypothetical protein